MQKSVKVVVEAMGKIVGKIILSFFLISAVILDARIALEVRTENGIRDRVVVGQPFTLDIVVDDIYGSVQEPTIKGLEKYAARNCGMYTSNINGKTSARYSYQVRIDTLGSHTIGPASVMHQQQKLVSNEVSINVVKDIGVGQGNGNQSSQAETKAFLRLMVDSESVVVGQKIGCTLRFYYQDPSISLHNITMPELPRFTVQEVSKLETGLTDIKGEQYRYAQWHWDMYPTKAGEFIIPAYNADYEIPLKDNTIISGLFMFMTNRAERKRVYSNALIIKVRPLPYRKEPVEAIGVFERMTAEIKPGMAKEGEGMVLTIEIEGMGNLHAISVPHLEMPEGLKYYDSHSSIIPPQHSDEVSKKRFEFIVQGMQCGDWEIPEQKFTYFDVERNVYATLRTSPLVVSIMPGQVSLKKEGSSTPPLFASEVAEVEAVEECIQDINTSGPWQPVTERQPLHWWLFQLLFLLPGAYIMYPRLSEKCAAVTGNSSRLKRRRAFKTARKKIEESSKNQNNKNLYAIFTDLLMTLDQRYDQIPKLSDQEICQWDEFFKQITQAAYGAVDNKDTDALCRMAKQWIERLEKIL